MRWIITHLCSILYIYGVTMLFAEFTYKKLNFSKFYTREIHALVLILLSFLRKILEWFLHFWVDLCIELNINQPKKKIPIFIAKQLNKYHKILCQVNYMENLHDNQYFEYKNLYILISPYLERDFFLFGWYLT